MILHNILCCRCIRRNFFTMVTGNRMLGGKGTSRMHETFLYLFLFSIFAICCIRFYLVTQRTGLKKFDPKTDQMSSFMELDPAYPKFSLPTFVIPDLNPEYKKCLLKTPDLTIKDLPGIMKLWETSMCRNNLNLLSQMYNITSRQGSLIIDNAVYKQKVLRWLGNDNDLYKEVLSQGIISVYNRYTIEEVVFNPLRAKRPVADTGASELAEIEKLYLETKASCDFCKAKIYTAHDKAGRMETKLSITAANTFRYEAVHQLVMPKSHHPLNWTEAELLDMFNLSIKWLKNEFHKNTSYSYPIIAWDLLPASGASQVHPHLQAILTPSRYPGVPENWRRAAMSYHFDYGRNYFSDLISIHDKFGLTVRYKSAVALATLTPKKENEVVIIGKEVNDDYLQLLYAVLRMYIEDKQLYSYSLAMALPPFSQNSTELQGEESADVLPAFTRILTRGKMTELRSDISSLELLTFSNVNSDPFALVKQIQKSVDSRLKSDK